jgi:cytochrome c nitrite reductase small subunit
MTERTRHSDAPSARPGSRSWRVRRLLVVVLACVLGGALGVGGFTFRYAEGLSYLSSDPTACVNCHIMRPQFDAWQKSSHHALAVCVDCHLPHDFPAKYLAKAEAGYRHSKEFTAGTFREPIVVQRRGLEILEDNCLRCHGELVAEMGVHSPEQRDRISCVRCHGGVGHGEVARLGGPPGKELKAEDKP